MTFKTEEAKLREEIEKLNKERYEELDKNVREGKFDLDKEIKKLAKHISQGKAFWRLMEIQLKQAKLQQLLADKKMFKDAIDDFFVSPKFLEIMHKYWKNKKIQLHEMLRLMTKELLKTLGL